MNTSTKLQLVYPDLQSNIEFYHEGNYRGMSADKLQVLIDLLKGKESELTDSLRELYKQTIVEIEHERERILEREQGIIFVVNDTYKQSDRAYSADCHSVINTKRGEFEGWKQIQASLGVSSIYPAMSKSAYIKIMNVDDEDVGMNLVVHDIMALEKEDDYETLKNIKSMHIGDIYVNQDKRGIGYGSDLFAASLEIAKSNDCQYISGTFSGENHFLEELIREKYPNIIIDSENKSFLINL